MSVLEPVVVHSSNSLHINCGEEGDMIDKIATISVDSGQSISTVLDDDEVCIVGMGLSPTDLISKSTYH